MSKVHDPRPVSQRNIKGPRIRISVGDDDWEVRAEPGHKCFQRMTDGSLVVDGSYQDEDADFVISEYTTNESLGFILLACFGAGDGDAVRIQIGPSTYTVQFVVQLPLADDGELIFAKANFIDQEFKIAAGAPPEVIGQAFATIINRELGKMVAYA